MAGHGDRLSVLIVEDHAMIGEMLAARMEGSGFTVDGVARTAGEGLALYNKHRSTLVLCDVRLEDGSSGIEMTKTLVAKHPKAVVVMVSAENEGHVVQEAYQAGAVGYVSKKATGPELLDTIADVLRGVTGAADRNTYRKLVEALRSPHPSKAGVQLTPREKDVLELMAQGTTTTAGLAAALGISQNSIRTHVEGLARKTGGHTRAEVVARSYQMGLIKLP